MCVCVLALGQITTGLRHTRRQPTSTTRTTSRTHNPPTGSAPLKTQNKQPANRTTRAKASGRGKTNASRRPHCRILSRISDISNGIPWGLNRGPSLLYSVPGLSVAWSSEPTVGVARNLHLSGDHYDQLFELKCGGLVGHVSDPQKRWLTNRPFRHQ